MPTSCQNHTSIKLNHANLVPISCLNLEKKNKPMLQLCQTHANSMPKACPTLGTATPTSCQSRASILQRSCQSRVNIVHKSCTNYIKAVPKSRQNHAKVMLKLLKPYHSSTKIITKHYKVTPKSFNLTWSNMPLSLLRGSYKTTPRIKKRTISLN